MLKKYQSDNIIYLLVQHVKYSCIVFSTVSFFCRLFEALSWAPAGGGAKVGATPPPPSLENLKKNCFAIWGSVCYFYTMWGPFRYFFLCVFFSGLPHQPYENFCVRPWALSHEAVYIVVLNFIRMLYNISCNIVAIICFNRYCHQTSTLFTTIIKQIHHR